MSKLFLLVPLFFQLTFAHAQITAPPVVPDVNTRIVALTRIEGVLLALKALAKDPDYTLETENNQEEFLRLHDYLDGLLAIQGELAGLKANVSSDLFVTTRLKTMLRELEDIGTDPMVELNGEDPDDHADLSERLENAREKLARVVEALQTFVADMKQTLPQNAILNPPELSQSNLTILRNVSLLRALVTELDHLSNFKNFYQFTGEDAERYAEFYSYVAYVNHVALAIKQTSDQLQLDPKAAGVVSDVHRKITGLVADLDRNYLQNDDFDSDGVESMNWTTEFENFQGKIVKLRDDIKPLADYYERLSIDSLSSLDSAAKLVAENPNLFDEDIRSQAASYEAERARLEQELSDLRASVSSQRAALNSINDEVDKATEQVELEKSRLEATLVEEASVRATLERRRKELANREGDLARLNATVPTLTSMLAQVSRLNGGGLTSDAEIMIYKASSKIATDKAFESLQKQLRSYVDMQLLHLRSEYQTKYPSLPFNLSTKIVLTKPRRTGLRRRFVADVGVTVTVESFGLQQSIQSELIKKVELGLNSKKGTAKDARLTKFLESVLPSQLTAALAKTNPAVDSRGERISDVVRKTCEAVLENFHGSSTPAAGSDARRGTL